MSNLSYEQIKYFYLDEDTGTPEAILPQEKWENGYRSDIEVEKGMTRATKDANDREKKSTDGESRFLRSTLCRPIPPSERAMHFKLARKFQGKRLSKKNREGLYEVMAPGFNIIKVSPHNSTIKELGKTIITVRNSDIAKTGTQQERQTPLKAFAEHRGPRTSKNLLEEKVQSHFKEITRKLKGDKKIKHNRRDQGSGVSSSKFNITRAMRGRILKVPNFSSAMRGRK